MATLLKVIGIIWAVIGAGNIIFGFAKMGLGHELLRIFSLIFNFVLFIAPGLLLAGLGAILAKKEQPVPSPVNAEGEIKESQTTNNGPSEWDRIHTSFWRDVVWRHKKVAILILLIATWIWLIPKSSLTPEHSTTSSNQPSFGPMRDGTVEIVEPWSGGRSCFDTGLTVNLSIRNTNSFDVKDIVVHSSGTAPSGTHIDDNECTIYEVVKAGQTKKINGFDRGFLLSQVSNVGCEIRNYEVRP